MLDRGWGKPSQPRAEEDGKKVRVTIRRITEGGVNGNGLTSTYRTTPVSDEALATSQAKLLRSPDRRS
jgi:hypothetical protein